MILTIFQLWEWGFPAHGSNCLLSVLLLKWNRKIVAQSDRAIAIEVEWAWLRRFNALRNWVLLLSCDYVLKFDWCCQLSGSGSNSLNSRKLPGRFSYGLGTRLCVNRLSRRTWMLTRQFELLVWASLCVPMGRGKMLSFLMFKLTVTWKTAFSISVLSRTLQSSKTKHRLYTYT